MSNNFRTFATRKFILSRTILKLPCCDIAQPRFYIGMKRPLSQKFPTLAFDSHVEFSASYLRATEASIMRDQNL